MKTKIETARTCSLVLSFQVLGMPATGCAMNVTVGSTDQHAELVECSIEGADGGDGDGSERTGGRVNTELLFCSASCGRIAAVSQQVALSVTLLDSHRRAVSSPHIIPFVLHVSSTSGSDSSGSREYYGISVLPLRLEHGNRQKIPYSIASVYASLCGEFRIVQNVLSST